MLVLLKYVEANPKRAKIVKLFQEYKYSSAYNRINNIEDGVINIPPIELPNNWNKYINEEESKIDVDYIRNSIKRQSTLGDELWQINIAKECEIESTLNLRGRLWKND